MIIPIEPVRGSRKPLNVRDFVVSHLAAVGEDHGSAMHQAYKARLREIGEANPVVPKARERKGRRPVTKARRYRAASYYSFTRQLQALEAEGIIKRSGRSEVSNHKHTEHWREKPLRFYYELA